MNLFKMVMTPMVERIKHRLNQIQVSHKKKTNLLLSVEPWSFNGDPHVGLL